MHCKICDQPTRGNFCEDCDQIIEVVSYEKMLSRYTRHKFLQYKVAKAKYRQHIRELGIV